MKAKRPLAHSTAAPLQRLAQARADDEARTIPWQRLAATRTHYIEWLEFCLWVRSITEAERGMPEWLSTIVNERCPGFVPGEKGGASIPLLGPRLEDWMNEHIFGFARREGWFNAIEFYAVRDSRYQRAEVCWSECVTRWTHARPIRYPSFEEWQAMAAACNEASHLVPEQRKAQASARLVGPERLQEAITRYLDWEAFAYWARPALEHGLPLPAEVKAELERRCPSFLARSVDTEKIPGDRIMEDLMAWIAERFFTDAQAEGWFDVLLIGVRRHPRAIRTMEYADHCDEIRGLTLPVPYPSFDDWRSHADAYVEVKTD
ncbi:MAG TPA: hypothetical protein VN577_18650 [Terriglobales bacterium]|nr:hypothetical protein [Terriglobales bacterium]